MPARWRERPLPASAERLAADGHDRRLATLLALRGIDSVEAARSHLAPALGSLHDPLALAGMERALELLLAARASSAPVAVVGDYDVDGLTATALLVGALRALGFAAEPILPSRRAGGYGLQPQHVERAMAFGAGLLVTADCGTTAHAALAAAAARGLPVIVTDHHLPGEIAPDAAALINPKQAGCGYPFRDLCGAGLAFKLAAALYARLDREPPWDSLLRMACLGTIADSVPLAGENRAIAKLGLAALPATRSPGLKALFARAQVRAPISASDVAFRLGPRLNAPGRIGDPDPALALLLARDRDVAERLADELELANRERQELERRVLDDCAAELERQRDAPLFVAWSRSWNKGVVGIAAGRLARDLHRPVLLFACEADGTATGSGRSVEGFDLHAFLAPGSAELVRFGGHSQAVGLTAETAKLEALRERWREQIAGRFDAEADAIVDYDLHLPAAELDLELARTMERLEPFGAGNPAPLFRVGPLTLVAPPRRFGQGHLGFAAADTGSGRVDVVAWKGESRAAALAAPFELLAALEVDRFGGDERARLRLVDVRPAESGEGYP